MKVLAKKKSCLEVPKEFCPQAVMEWSKCGAHCDKRRGPNNSDVKEKARNHLSFLGWSFWYAKKKDRMELRYTSPAGKTHYSLRMACKACINGDCVRPEIVFSNSLVHGTCLFPEKVTNFSQEKGESGGPVLSGKPTGDHSPSTIESSTEFTTKGRKRSRSIDFLENLENSELVQFSQECKISNLHVGSKDDQIQIGSITDSNSEKPSSSKGKKVISGLRKPRTTLPVSNCKKKSPKNARIKIKNIPVSSSRSSTAKTVLSMLIDSNVVALGAKVRYRGKQFSGGVITREGIECDCCSKVFALTAYEEHVGSTNHRPAANILLEDGRSLTDCKNEIKMMGGAVENVKRKVNGKEKNILDCNRDESDDICSVCHYGGDLVLCDLCPSAFHTTCLGFERAPDGDWFCPSCRCGICGQAKLEETKTELANNDHDHDMLICFQCERKFHKECLRNAGVKVKSENVFCSRKCEDICSGLKKIVGKRVQVGEDEENLSWTLLKAAENDTKLEAALFVMHECFEPARDPLTNRDIVEDVFFGRESKLSRLNFRGFYIVVLEKEDELITVATVRVYGEKLAEVPLVATRFEYRRRGMCHVLMKELEKQLGILGVERLTLPSASSVLQTWTTHFGFSVMTAGEKLRFLNYNLLDFQGTYMCQKRLIDQNTGEAKSSLCESENSPSELVDYFNGSFFSEEDIVSLHSILGSVDLPNISTVDVGF